MKNIFLSSIVFTAILFGCKDESEHVHGAGGHSHGLEPVAYTIYTDKTELFVEFKPLVIGQTSKFAAHFTQLGDQFTAIEEGSVTVSLIANGKGIKHSAEAPSSPGIFRLALQPKEKGIYQLVFDIETKDYTDRIVIDSVSVYSNDEDVLANIQEDDIGEEITYLKEQAWKVDFANMEVLKQPFAEVIKTTGQILPAQGDEIVVTAKSNGIITFGKSKKTIGSSVYSGETLFNISGSSLSEDNLDSKYKKLKANNDKNKVDYDRAKELVKENIISQKEYQEVELKYNNSKNAFNTLAKNYSANGQKITSSLKGFIKNILVSEGQYVEVGQQLATISQNRKLQLVAEIPQKHFSNLNNVTSANFKTAYSNKLYNTTELNGKLISYGKSAGKNEYFIPLNFEIDNAGDLISGSFIEVYLKTNKMEDALVIPNEALIEEQGKYYAYVQTSGEGFQKRELEIGLKDGSSIQVISGIEENERVVTTGAYQIKLATMSGKMPAHGHEH